MNLTKTLLILGAGHTARKRLNTTLHNIVTVTDSPDVTVTVDIEAETKPDIVHDLECLPWPLHDNDFNEVHAYEILEHFGRQGDYQAFFAHFGELWRVLQPNGRLYASVPCHDSIWTFGDPGHTRVLNSGSLVFLVRANYAAQLGKTAMSDYRRYLVGDWAIEYQRIIGESFCFVLKAIK